MKKRVKKKLEKKMQDQKPTIPEENQTQEERPQDVSEETPVSACSDESFSQDEIAETNSVAVDDYHKVVAERDDYIDHLKRLQAEFDNFRKRTQKERIELKNFLVRDIITRLLDVIGNMERALRAESEDLDSYKAGVQMVYQQFTGILGDFGLQKIETIGKPFDPRFHEAVSQMESEEHEPGTILMEITPGYQINDLVIQAPRVQVAAAVQKKVQESETQEDADSA